MSPEIHRLFRQQSLAAQVQRAQYAAYALIFTIFGVAVLFSNGFRSIFTPGPYVGNALFLSRIALAVSVTILVVMWISATAHELHLWIDLLEPIFVRNHVYGAMLFLGLSLGVMPLLTPDVRLFAAYYAGFLVLNLWTQSITNATFARTLALTRNHWGNNVLLDYMEDYWMRRPQLGRIWTMSGCAGSALVLVWVAQSATPLPEYWLTVAAYVILTATIIGGELVIGRWRMCRDQAIEDAIAAGEDMAIQADVV